MKKRKQTITSFHATASRDWLVIFMVTLFLVLAIIVTSFALRSVVRNDTSFIGDGGLLFGAEDVHAMRRFYDERAIQFEVLRGVPVYLVDPAL